MIYLCCHFKLRIFTKPSFYFENTLYSIFLHFAGSFECSHGFYYIKQNIFSVHLIESSRGHQVAIFSPFCFWVFDTWIVCKLCNHFLLIQKTFPCPAFHASFTILYDVPFKVALTMLFNCFGTMTSDIFLWGL